jgi:hypothetical protein
MSFLSEITIRKSLGQTRESIIALFESDLLLVLTKTIVETPREPHQPLSIVEGQTVSFKNLGSNEFMNDIGYSRQTLTSSKEFVLPYSAKVKTSLKGWSSNFRTIWTPR